MKTFRDTRSLQTHPDTCPLAVCPLLFSACFYILCIHRVLWLRLCTKNSAATAPTAAAAHVSGLRLFSFFLSFSLSSSFLSLERALLFGLIRVSFPFDYPQRIALGCHLELSLTSHILPPPWVVCACVSATSTPRRAISRCQPVELLLSTRFAFFWLVSSLRKSSSLPLLQTIAVGLFPF